VSEKEKEREREREREKKRERERERERGKRLSEVVSSVAVPSPPHPSAAAGWHSTL